MYALMLARQTCVACLTIIQRAISATFEASFTLAKHHACPLSTPSAQDRTPSTARTKGSSASLRSACRASSAACLHANTLTLNPRLARTKGSSASLRSACRASSAACTPRGASPASASSAPAAPPAARRPRARPPAAARCQNARAACRCTQQSPAQMTMGRKTLYQLMLIQANCATHQNSMLGVQTFCPCSNCNCLCARG